jgi:hypothetical protein
MARVMDAGESFKHSPSIASSTAKVALAVRCGHAPFHGLAQCIQSALAVHCWLLVSS